MCVLCMETQICDDGDPDFKERTKRNVKYFSGIN
jgi:hypothetical protein